MKRVLLGGLLVVAILAAGAAAYVFTFRDGGSSHPKWSLSTWTGDVEVSLGGGAWQPAAMHVALGDGDKVRTATDGEATLVLDKSHVTVRAETVLQVAQLNRESSRFSLAEGQVYIEARGDRIAMKSTAGAQLDAKDAGVGMTVRKDGWTQVQVKRGEADFTAMDRTEHVAEGQESHAEVGAPPSAAAPIPDDLLLNVQFPDADTFNTRLARVEGKSDPGARVRVAGRAVEVGSDGRWTAEVPLQEGVQQIEVVAQDSIGQSRTERSQPIRVDMTAPSLSGAAIGSHQVGNGG